MDTRLHNFGFSGNQSSSAFGSLSNPLQADGTGGYYHTDTILRLDFPSSISYLPSSRGVKRKWNLVDGYPESRVNSSLFLGEGRSSSSSDIKGSSATACTTTSSAKENEEESSMDVDLDFSLHLGSEKSPRKSAVATLKGPETKPKVDLELSLSTGFAESELTTVHTTFNLQNAFEEPLVLGNSVGTEEGSFSRGKERSHVSSLHSLFDTDANFVYNTKIGSPFSCPGLSSNFISTQKSSVTCTLETKRQPQVHDASSKTCRVEGCGKGARGASGYCISHGGGRRCQKPGCLKGAEGRTVYCKAHGGGRRCEFLGCTKSAEGRTDFCIAHGGGRRCTHEGCKRAARGKSGLCIRHGGGKRCHVENCTKSAEGLSGLCISHGGGRRCQHRECTKGAQGSTMFCKAHGGGKRCSYEGCTKGAEGSTLFCKGHGGGKRCLFQGGGVCTKSVHGGTLFCVAHGGGKRCAVPECSKSARGRTDYCVRHGGGKRCRIQGCGKSAQGSTDFCKAHGGGKRCSWGHPGSEFGQNDRPCVSVSRGTAGLCASHSALVQDKRVHGGGALGKMVQDAESSIPEKMTMNTGTCNIGITKTRTERVSPYWNSFDLHHNELREDHASASGGGAMPIPDSVTEGRVHGGGLMAMLAGSSQSHLNPIGS